MFFIFILILFFVFNEVFAFFKSSRGDVLVEISRNVSIAKISKILKKNKIIGSSFLFSKYVALKNVKLKYGIFNLNSSMSYEKIVHILTDENKNESDFTKLNIFEGSNMFNLREKNLNVENFNIDEIIKILNSEKFYSRFNFYKFLKSRELLNSFYPMEGFCATDSFNIKNGYDSLTVANLILSCFDERISKFLSNFSDEFKNSKFDLWQLITIASIIQGETHRVEDMPLISSVIHNRLNLKVRRRLECDVTRNYAKNMKKMMEEKGFQIDQKKIDSYNTYKCFGLPAGPVCNPGDFALRAAIKPAKTDYYYFCVDLKTDKALFARTFSEHCKNLKRVNLV